MQVIPLNSQPIEKSVNSDGLSLDIHSIFYTIQGEGPFTGHPAVFVRLAGCNLQCPSCDTDYTAGRENMILEEIVYAVQQAVIGVGDNVQPMVVITGGEPFRQNITLLCLMLVMSNITVQIETNGTLAPPPDMRDHSVWSKVHIICSPKAGRVNPWIEQRAKAFKYVLSHDSIAEDGLPVRALNHTASPRVHRCSRAIPIYLQPMDAKDEAANKLNIEAVVKSCMTFGYLLQLQVHKFIGVD